MIEGSGHMTGWQFVTTNIPFENERDVMARIGLRFLRCTGPYLLIAAVLSRFGIERLPTNSWSALLLILIPILGGAIDWSRLKRMREDARVSGSS